MTRTRRSIGFVLMSAAATLVIAPAVARLLAQEPPNRREFTISARDYRFHPDRIEVAVDDLVKLTVRSEDVAYSFTIDQFRVSKRVPAGGTVTFEFRADRGPGTYSYYSNMTSDPRHAGMKGELVVRAR